MQLVEARAFLERHLGDVRAVRELGGGDWSRAYSFRLAGRDLVARFGRYRDDFEADRRAMAYGDARLPVPEVLEIGEAPGGYFAISQRHFGAFLESLDETRWRRVLPAVFAALDVLGAVRTAQPPSCTWPEWLRSSLIDQPSSRTAGWRDALARLPAADELFERGRRAFDEAVGACPPDAGAVLHRDLLNRNVLVAEDGSRLEAVFDWGCSVPGDTLYDIAWLTFWAPWYPGLAAVEVAEQARANFAASALDATQFDARLRCYELHIGLEHLAYAAYTEREAHLHDIASRTEHVLSGE